MELRLGSVFPSSPLFLLLLYKRPRLGCLPIDPSAVLDWILSSPRYYNKELAASASKKKLEEEPPVPGATADQGESEEQRNKFLVLRLYEALNGRDHAGVQALLAPDLEWWFHGPPKHQHMMRVLTGAAGAGSSSSSFRFAPRSVDAFGSTVIAEGGDHQRRVYWVHAWTVGSDGVITQLREYFNTDLTVTRLELAAATKCECIWQSRRPDRATNSLPGLVLAL